jgi:hypothetical protein
MGGFQTRAALVATVVALMFADQRPPVVTAQAGQQPTTIVELRQYTLRPGQRDVLIDLFEREFVESQEAVGMRIVGTFRDLDRPDRFVWIRGFTDMAARPAALKAFYEGPVWRAHRQAANATMIDSANVLLLHAARPGTEFPDNPHRAPKGSSSAAPGLVVATIYYFEKAADAGFVQFFDETVKPRLEAANIQVAAAYLSETLPNNFAPLPIRERDHVFTWFSLFGSEREYEDAKRRLSESAGWRPVNENLRRRLSTEPEVLRLVPTPRSALHQ